MIHTNDEAEKIINSIGCLAELLTVFYNSLHRGGLSEAQSFSLTEQLLDIMLCGGGVEYEEDEEE